MRHFLSEDEKRELDRLIREAEGRVKAQIVLAVIRRCDNYPEIPWKVFALSASIAGLLVFLYNLFFPGWITNAMILISISAILAIGAFFALLSVLIPGFARLFLNHHRAETETRQYAESIFFEHELFATGERSAILLMVSMFERQVILLPDKGTGSRLTIEVMNEIIAPMYRPLKQREVKLAMETGLEQLTRALEASASGRTVKDVLSNEIIEEEGV